MMMAAKVLAEGGARLKGDLLVAATAGEEVDCIGVKQLLEAEAFGEILGVVLGEPTMNNVLIAERGALWLQLVTLGSAAHTCEKSLGRNAIEMMIVLLQELKERMQFTARHPLLGAFEMSLNTICGGTKANMVPDRCEVCIDMRTLPCQEHAKIVDQVRAVIAEVAAESGIDGFRADVRVVNDRPALETPADSQFVQGFLDAVESITGVRPSPGGAGYYTEAVEYVDALGAPFLICGPGSPAESHKVDESVQIPKLKEAAHIYALAALGLIGECRD